MKSSDIPFIKPSFPPLEELANDYATIVANNWYTNFGPYERKFSKKIEEFIGQGAHVATVNSATSGIIAALIAVFGKGDGTEFILVPSFTFIAGPQAIVLCGYKPLFVDITEPGLHMSLSQTKTLVKTRRDVKGIFLCNSFGVGNPEIDAWEAFAEAEQLPLVIDSAAGFGSRYPNGEYLGARGACEIFSFHATKPFAIGEGGAVTSRDQALIKKIDAIQNFGFDKPRNSSLLGFNGKLQEINAAIGLRQLIRFATRLEERQATLEFYKQSLTPLGVTLQANAEKSSVCFCTILLPESAAKDKVLDALHTAGVQAKDYYNPLVSEQHYFVEHPESFAQDSLTVSQDVAARIISLPTHDNMDKVDLARIINTIKGQLTAVQ